MSPLPPVSRVCLGSDSLDSHCSRCPSRRLPLASALLAPASLASSFLLSVRIVAMLPPTPSTDRHPSSPPLPLPLPAISIAHIHHSSSSCNPTVTRSFTHCHSLVLAGHLPLYFYSCPAVARARYQNACGLAHCARVTKTPGFAHCSRCSCSMYFSLSLPPIPIRTYA